MGVEELGSVNSMPDVIFGSLLKNDDEVLVRKQHLITTFGNTSVFKNEYYVFYLLVRDHIKINPDSDFITMYMKVNKGLFSKNPNVNLSSYNLGDAEPYVEFVNSVLTVYDNCRRKVVSNEDYFKAVEMYRMEYMSVESIKILEASTNIVSDGLDVRGKRYSGYEDMRAYSKSRFMQLDNMMSKSDRKGLIMYGVNDQEESEDGQVKLVSKFGIEPLDNAIGGIYEGDMVSLLAPAKGGKSRMATFMLHNALINGTSVAMWSIENGYKGWEALLRARHFKYFYDERNIGGEGKRFINADMIRKGTLPPELKEMELASWTDLKCNKDYGRIINIDEDFDADTFLEVMDTAVANGAKLICIDYWQLVTEGNSKGAKAQSKNERIGDCYKKTLQFLKSKKVGGIFPGQLKQTVVGNLNKTDAAEFVNTELRDAAGESYEVIKTPDVNLALYATVEDLRQGSMKILSIPSRNIAPFEPIDLACDMGSCSFYPVSSDDE